MVEMSTACGILGTGRIHETRNVVWLRRMYFPAPTHEPEVNIIPDDDAPTLLVKAGESPSDTVPETNNRVRFAETSNATNPETPAQVQTGNP